MALTRVAAAGISTVGTFALQNINTSGIVTATGGFVGDVTGNVTGDLSGNVSGTAVTATTANFTNATISGDLTVQGTTTTLDTTLTEVDKLEVGANNTTVGVAITQSGTGDILRLYDSSTQVVTVKDGGSVGIGTDNPAVNLHVNSASSTGRIRIQGGGTSSAQLQLMGAGRVNPWVITGDSSDRFIIYDNADARLMIDSSGRVAVGTVSPQDANPAADNLVVGPLSGANGITIQSATDNNGNLFFSDGSSGDDRIRGFVQYQHNENALLFGTNALTRASIDSSGRLLVGTNSSRSKWFNTTVDAALIQSETTDLNVFSGVQNSANAFGPWMLLGKSRGSSVGAVTVVQNNDQLGSISFQGADGTEMVEGAKIQAFADGTPAANEMPGRLVFFTNNGTANATPTERMRISANGDINIDSGAFYFDAVNNRFGLGTTSPQNSLDVIASGARAGVNGCALHTSDNSNSRFYIGHDTGNTTNLVVDSSNNLTFGQTNGSAYTERMRLDTSGRLLVGTSSVSTNSTAVFQSRSDGAYEATVYFNRGSAPTDAGDPVLGNLFFGDNSSNIGAQIQSRRDGGTWTSGSSHPSRLVFATTADGASSPTERMRIASNGKCTFSPASSVVGIEVNANGSAQAAVFNNAYTGDASPTVKITTSGTNNVAPALNVEDDFYIYGGGRVVSSAVYNTTTASAANVFVGSNGIIERSTSSAKYKTDIQTLEDQYADAILGVRPVWYRSTCELDNPDWGWWGFIAEEVAEVDPRLCFFKENEDGSLEPEGVQYDRFVPHLVNLIKRQQQAIETLEARLTALEGQ